MSRPALVFIPSAWLLVGLACLIVFTSGCNTAPHSRAAVAATEGAAPVRPPALRRPATGLLDLDGRPVDLLQRTSERITVVVFTRTDCPISNRFAPEIRHLGELYAPRGADFYLVYVDPHETPTAIRQHLLDYRYPFPALRDPTQAFATHCHATVTPEAVVFARDGTLAYRGRVCDQYVDLGNAKPAPTTHDLADALEATVTGRPVSTPLTRAVGCAIADLKE